MRTQKPSKVEKSEDEEEHQTEEIMMNYSSKIVTLSSKAFQSWTRKTEFGKRSQRKGIRVEKEWISMPEEIIKEKFVR